MKILKAAAVLPLVLMLSQCEQKPAAPSAYAFDVELEVTPAAAQVMKANNSHFIAAAYYFGRVREGAEVRKDAIGRVRLGYDQIGMTQGALRVHFPASDFDASLLPSLTTEPQVMVNVFSAKAVGTRDDVVACKTYVGYLKVAQSQTPRLACDLKRF